MKTVFHLFRAWSASPCRGWFLIFLLANALIDLDYGTNPESRFATLAALVEDHSFRIDRYKDLTIDWARTPDGHYYSNKAPGPMLLAYPVFWLIDTAVTTGTADRAGRDEARLAHRRLTLRLLSFLFQTLPFAVIVLVGLSWLEGWGASRAALHLSCVAMLLGNTAALFMSTYFGHAMAATCVLALCLFLIRRWYVWSGLAYGLALLTDYSSALLLPGFLAAALLRAPAKERLEGLAKIGVGGLVPGVLWVFYHVACFGGPFTLPSKYQNPMFVDAAHNPIFGIFNLFPNPTTVVQLLCGFRRGILWSQPWLLIGLAACLWPRPLLARLSGGNREAVLVLRRFLLPGLFLLLWMNASFGEWQGGSTPGPRYLCSVFPAFGLLAGVLYDTLPGWLRRLMIGATAVSAAFWMLAYSTHILVPADATMWGFTLGVLLNEASYSSLVRLAGLCLAIQWQLFRTWGGIQAKVPKRGNA